MKSYLTYAILNWILAFILDFLLGDPHFLWHPVQGMGSLIQGLEHLLYPKENTVTGDEEAGEDLSQMKRRRGLVLVCLVLAITLLVTGGILFLAYWIHPYLFFVFSLLFSWQALAARSLVRESKKVYAPLAKGDLTKARETVSMIVGRDTEVLDEAGVTRACVETVAENCSDGVIAPLFYLLLGGPLLAFCYKAINTMDSMIAYHNERYEDFGRAAARLDDLANWLPARLSALLLLLAAALLGSDYSAREGWRIFCRDRYRHKSPNSAHTESVMAGVLGLALGGDAYYFGRIVKKEEIGDARRQIVAEDIPRACLLMYVGSALFWLMGGTILYLTYMTITRL